MNCYISLRKLEIKWYKEPQLEAEKTILHIEAVSNLRGTRAQGNRFEFWDRDRDLSKCGLRRTCFLPPIIRPLLRSQCEENFTLKSRFFFCFKFTFFAVYNKEELFFLFFFFCEKHVNWKNRKYIYIEWFLRSKYEENLLFQVDFFEINLVYRVKQRGTDLNKMENRKNNIK